MSDLGLWVGDLGLEFYDLEVKKRNKEEICVKSTQSLSKGYS